MKECRFDVVVIGGGTGGCAAAMAACDLGKRVLMTEEFAWIGGQLTSQAVPPDEHPWIESHGSTRRYRRWRNGVRHHYRRHYPLTSEANQNPFLNPGSGWVSRICTDPRVAHHVLQAQLSAAQGLGLLEVWTGWVPVSADVEGTQVRSVTVRSLATGEKVTVHGEIFLDATELGDLLPMTGTEYVIGAESRAETGEPNAPESADPNDIQGFTWCFAMGFAPGENRTIEKPAQYDHWVQYKPELTPPWPNNLFSWTVSNPITWETRTFSLFGKLGMFSYRQIVDRRHFDRPDVHDVTIVNWAQNDCLQRAIDVSPEELARVYENSRQLSLSLLYWLQTEAPREDGGVGYPELYLVPAVVGTRDGLAMAPYHREARRIRAEFTVTENHVAVEARNACGFSERFADSVGVGAYRIDLHPSCSGRNSVDISSYPFQIPLGSLIPQRVDNLLPACKNLGVTHITNGCYRLHPVEWNIGESAGILAAFCLERGVLPRQVLHNETLLAEYQMLLKSQGVQIEWPSYSAL